MGNLIIKKVSYNGEKYFFESPELTTGINIIVGDNGSGKSTFSYLIEFGLGGDIPYFKKGHAKGNYRYDLIIEDTNNYVLLEILINNKLYSLKRFIGTNDIFIKEKDIIVKFPIYRNADYAPYIFSDWILEKLGIPLFELSLGTSNWLINFKDLFRLLTYDQDTETRKIFKKPSADNYIADSSVIRKSIFETLVGMSSQEFNIIFNDFKKAQNDKNEAKSLFDNNNNLYAWLANEKLDEKEKKFAELEDQLEKLYEERQNYQLKNTDSSAKTNQLEDIQSELISLELDISEKSIKRGNFEIERSKTKKLLEQQKDEISQIEKIIFTHEKLNLFSLEICPFCMSEISTVEGICICGSKIKDDDYEKFVYKSGEYKEILDHRKKSIQAVELATDSYDFDIQELDSIIYKNKLRADSLRKDLKNIIDSIAFSGNSQLIDRINDKILEVQNSLATQENTIKLLLQRNKLKKDFDDKNFIFKNKKKAYEEALIEFEKNNKTTIEDFNIIYSELLSKSSCKSTEAEINEEYMPYIDKGTYKQKSALVPIRLMYYFTLLSLGLKNDKVLHPRFLLIDTPESEGIDEGKLKLNLELLNYALELSKNSPDDKVKDFQVILTTGVDKYPESYAPFIKEVFSEKDNDFILKLK